MILRLSDDLSKKIRVTPGELIPLNANPFADWSCHLFRAGRLQYVIAANTASLYGVIFPGGRITRGAHFASSLFGHLQEQMTDDGYEFLYKRLIDTEGADVHYSKPLNPVITAAVNDLAELAAYYLEDEALSLEETIRKINDSPLSVIDHAHPRDAFRALSFH